jgi:hypothetical protein
LKNFIDLPLLFVYTCAGLTVFDETR